MRGRGELLEEEVAAPISRCRESRDRDGTLWIAAW